MSGDIFYGKVPLPDGRICNATVYGRNVPDDFWTKGGFDLNDDNPLEIDNIDGDDFDDSEYELEYVVNGKTVTLEEFCIDYLCEHGTFETGETYYDD